MNQRFFHFFLCVLMLFVVGCGGPKKPDGMPALHKTTLTLTQDGAPLAGASVSLVPVTGAMLWPAGGITDAKGTVNIRTMTQFDGAPEGSYKITVIKTEEEKTGEVVKMSEVDGGATVPVVKTYNVVDKKYQSPQNSDLTLDVKSGKNVKTFEVGKAVRELIPVNKN